MPRAALSPDQLQDQVSCSVPITLKAQLEADAEAQGTTVGNLARNIIAAHYGVELSNVPTRGRAPSDLSDEDRKRIQKEKATARRNDIRAQVEALKSKLAGNGASSN